jgi:hypothetical protein
VPEILRLSRLAEAGPARRAAGLRWSVWRRRHQAIARDGHIIRRARTHPPPTMQSAKIVPLPGVPPLDEDLLRRLRAVLPPAAPRGRPRVDAGQVLGGIVWLMRSGRTWRDIPPEFGPWATLASRYRLWQQDGTWARVAHVLTATEPANADGSNA